MKSDNPFIAKAANEYRLLQAEYLMHAFKQANDRDATSVGELETWLAEGDYIQPSTEELQKFIYSKND